MTPQTWLITGGAGYIGAHVADEFLVHGLHLGVDCVQSPEIVNETWGSMCYDGTANT